MLEESHMNLGNCYKYEHFINIDIIYSEWGLAQKYLFLLGVVEKI